MIHRPAFLLLAAALCAPVASFAQRIVSLLDTTAAPVVVDSLRHRAYFSTERSIAVFDGANMVSGVGAGATPYWMAFDSPNQRLYTIDSYMGLTILDVTKMQAITSLRDITAAGVINTNTQRMYFPTAQPGIRELNGETGATLGSYSLPGLACSMAIDEPRNRLYVSHCSENLSGASVIDLDTRALTFIPVPHLAAQIAVNPSTGLAYVITNDGGTAIAVIDGGTKQYHYLQTGATGTGKPSWIGVNPSTNRVYARFGNQYFVIDGVTEAVLARTDGTNTALDGSIADIRIDPVMNRIYVLVDGDTLVALDASTLAEVSHQQLPVIERSMDLDAGMHRLYTAGAGGLLIDTSATPGPRMNNYQGLWWNPNESGWGVNIAQQGDVWFAAWYTYDHDGKPTWFVMPRGSRSTGEMFSGTLYRATAGPGASYQSQSFDSSSVVATPVGTMTFSFSDANTGTMVADVNGAHIAKAITRQQLASPGLVCQTGIAASPQNATDLWWQWPAGSGSGWGLFVTQQTNTAFSVWFTYDTTGRPTWFATTGARNTSLSSVIELNGDVYQTTGPAYDAPSWDASLVHPTRVGTMKIGITDDHQGAFSFTIGSVSSSQPIVRERFAKLFSACQ